MGHHHKTRDLIETAKGMPAEEHPQTNRRKKSPAEIAAYQKAYRKANKEILAARRREFRGRGRSQPSQDVFGQGPVRVTIYVYPWMLERIDRWAKKQGTTKRQVFMEALMHHLNEYEKYYGK